jgi:hypothetical protein
MIRGTKAAMRLHRSGFEVYGEVPRYTEAFTFPTPILKESSPRDGGLDHMKNFLDCVKSRNAPNASVEIGVAAARAGHVANLAMRGSGVWSRG